jgi:UDP-2-acetamido-3-amino-2,3-dideoxy-glucuronate N-acetyltransferase
MNRLTFTRELHMIHPSVKIGQYCIIHPDAVIGEGTVIMNYVEIRSGTVIGRDCYIDSGVKISGQCKIGDRVTLRYNTIIARGCNIGNDNYLAPNCMTNNLDSGKVSIGGATTGAGCFFGTGTVLQHGITIADRTITGVGSFVNKDVPQTDTVLVGCPAKPVRK